MRKLIFFIMLIFLIAPGIGILGEEETGGEARSKPAGAVEATKVKMTIYKMQDIGFFVERYEIDKRMYPDTKFIEDLSLLADLNYFMRIPTKDQWGKPFRYVRTSKKEGEGVSYYKIISAGPEGRDDEYIIYSNGFFIKYPEEFKYLFD